MNKVLPMILTILFSLNAQALFEVKDASDNTVLEISNDGLRVFNLGDTLMVISSSEIKAFIDSSTTKALSRSFSVTTSAASGKDALSNAFEVTTGSAQFNSGLGRYTDFSPDNIFLGLNSGINTVPNGSLGRYNVFLGNSSGSGNISGVANVFIGVDAGSLGTESHNNTLIGTSAGLRNTAGSNVFIGASAGAYSQTGGDNVFIGLYSGVSNNSGNSNVFIGSYSGDGDEGHLSVGTGNNNVLIGDSCGFKHLYGNNNTMLGSKSGLDNISGVGNVFIGNESGFTETGSNKLYIDNSATTTPLIYGDFSANTLKFNGDVGIGKTPLYALDILDDYVGIYSEAVTTTGTSTYGVFSQSSGGSVDNYAIFGYAPGTTGTNWAGYFSGNVNVTGTLSKGAGSFKIDHPLDPENKYLYHSFVESPDMKNIYDGVVFLDNNGEASVTLPSYFEALNNKFRYQLTAIGAPAPNLYVAQEISNNEFKIAGGNSGMKVSWMVTGIRKDNYANKNRIPIEVDKRNEDRGYYLHPEAFGVAKEKGIDHKLMKKEMVR